MNLFSPAAPQLSKLHNSRHTLLRDIQTLYYTTRKNLHPRKHTRGALLLPRSFVFLLFIIIILNANVNTLDVVTFDMFALAINRFDFCKYSTLSFGVRLRHPCSPSHTYLYLKGASTFHYFNFLRKNKMKIKNEDMD